MLGYKKSELLRMRPEDISASKASLLTAHLQAIRKKGHATWQSKHVRKDGVILDVEVRATILEYRGVPTLLAIVRNISEEKRMKEQLMESEDRFRKLAELLPESIYEMDESGRLTFVNRNAFYHFGYTETDLGNGLAAFDMIAPEDRERAAANMQEVMQGADLGLVEYTAVRKDGTRFPVIIRSTRVIRDGKPAGIRGMIIDVTERKKVEERLRREYYVLNRIMETIPAGIVLVDREGRVTFANTSAEQLLGLSKEHIRQRTYNDSLWHITDSDGNSFPEDDLPFNRVMKTGRAVHNVQHAVQWPDGRRVLLNINAAPLFGEDGSSFEGMVASLEDVTEQKHVARVLEESEKRHRTFVENIPIGIYRVTPGEKGRFLMANPAFLDMFGYASEEEVKGLSVSDIYMDPRERKSFSDTLLKLGSVYMTDRRLKRKDGTPLWATVTARVVPGNERAEGPCLFDCAIVDITERKRAEEERRNLEIQFQHAQRMEAIGTLAGGIAHDFNNLLMGIQGNTSLMLFDLDPNHPHSEKLKNIQKYVENGAHLTRQLLGFARGGKYEVKPTQLNDLILKSSEMFGRTKKEITIHCELQENLHIVKVDRGQIEQVLLNLYVNAWQAMPDGGELFLRTKNICLDHHDVAPYGLKEGPYVRFSVTDTGVGMDEAVQQRIFEPFFTTKDMGRGTGLGLASAYGIIKNHGGRIEVRSTKGNGTTFHIYLPASENGETLEEKALDHEILLGRETVLLVDDETMILDVGKEILEALGYHVTTASSGQEAVEVFRRAAGEIDVVVLDLIMPGMSAAETMLALKQMHPRPNVLLSSGYSEDGQAMRIMEMGCQGFIQKPFTLKEFSRKLREVLDKS